MFATIYHILFDLSCQMVRLYKTFYITYRAIPKMFYNTAYLIDGIVLLRQLLRSLSFNGGHSNASLLLIYSVSAIVIADTVLFILTLFGAWTKPAAQAHRDTQAYTRSE